MVGAPGRSRYQCCRPQQQVEGVLAGGRGRCSVGIRASLTCTLTQRRGALLGGSVQAYGLGIWRTHLATLF